MLLHSLVRLAVEAQVKARVVNIELNRALSKGWLLLLSFTAAAAESLTRVRESLDEHSGPC
jgi:hypothetical protein